MLKQTLNASRSKFSTNKQTEIKVELERNERLIPFSHAEATVQLHDVYLAEREESNRYRFIFSITPVCSNILYNINTEIVKNEGANNVVVLSDTPKNISNLVKETPLNEKYVRLTRFEAIRDTEYSHPNLGNFTYHCGLDIFNNHIFRAKDFTTLQKRKPENEIYSKYYNTIEDFALDSQGDIMKEMVPYSEKDGIIESTPYKPTKIDMHKYNHDNLYSFFESISANLKEKDGWLGFENITTLPIDLRENLFVNKVMNRNKSYEFYDLYPDRELYSFIPKINHHRDREEKNWEYCLTYPAKKEYMYGGCDILYDETTGINGIKAQSLGIKDRGTVRVLMLKTPIKHNLKESDYITLFLKKENKIEENNVYVFGLGDENKNDKEHIIQINIVEVENFWTSAIDDIRIGKIENGVKNEYYFRVFRKIPNINKSPKNILEEEILDDATISNLNALYNFNSIIGKMGYARSIYGDSLAQLIFNDNIELGNLIDHRGRPLSEIFLTIIKNNKGYKEWYEDNTPDSPNVEFSHCFGKVSSGLDIIDENFRDYNIHCIHNVDVYDRSISYAQFPESGKKLDEDITISDEYFIGDIVEWNSLSLTEIELEKINFRFNTYQREDTKTNTYKGLVYDELVYDDYDYLITDNGPQKFTVSSLTLTTQENERSNVYPEGYYYEPHKKIQIKEYSDDLIVYNDKRIILDNGVKISDYEYSLESSMPYALHIGDILKVWYKNKQYTAMVIDVSGAFKFKVRLDNDFANVVNNIRLINNYDIILLREATFFTPYLNLPRGAQMVPNSYGEYRFRPFNAYFSTRNEKLKNATFTNGALYYIDEFYLFLKRQDPFGKYGLKYDGIWENMLNINKTEPIDASIDKKQVKTLFELC